MHHPTDRITHTTAFVTPVVDSLMEPKTTFYLLKTKTVSDILNKLLFCVWGVFFWGVLVVCFLF